MSEKGLSDSTTFWLAFGGVVTAIGTFFLAIGTVQRIGPASLWENGWFRTGFGMAVVGMCAVLWSVVLFLAHRHVEKHESTPPLQLEISTDDVEQVSDLGWARSVLRKQLDSPTEFVRVTHGRLAGPLDLDLDSPRVYFMFTILNMLVVPITVESLQGMMRFNRASVEPPPDIDTPEAPVELACGERKTFQVQQWLIGNVRDAVRASITAPIFDATGLAFRCSFSDPETGKHRTFDVPILLLYVRQAS